jgi:hypothetical protein
MRNFALKYLPAAVVLSLPDRAYAQEIPPLIGALALSPILVMLLALVLGIVARSWRVGAAHAALVVVWLLLFGIASYWVENDYVIWTPLALYALHALIMLALIVQRLIRRRG